MLDNLKGLNEARAVKPEEMSEGLRTLFEAERKLSELDEIDDIHARKVERELNMDLVSKLSSLKKEDLIDYILMHNDPEQVTGMLGRLTGKALDNLFTKNGHVELNLYHHLYPYLFSDASNVKDLTVEQARCYSLCDRLGAADRIDRLVFANCKCNDILSHPNLGKGARLIIAANCQAESFAVYHKTSEDEAEYGIENTDYMIIANSVIENITPGFADYHACRWHIKINSGFDNDWRYTRLMHGHNIIYLRSEGKGVIGGSRESFPITDSQIADIHEIGLSMQGKGASEIAKLAEDIVSIIQEVENRA